MIAAMNCFAKFLAQRIKSFGHALNGLGYMVRVEGNARVHLLATLVVLGLGWGLGVSAAEWALLIIAITLVWVAELLNSALELLCDIVSPEYSDKVKRAKDMAAAAVLVAAIGAAGLGALVFVPYFWAV